MRLPTKQTYRNTQQNIPYEHDVSISSNGQYRNYKVGCNRTVNFNTYPKQLMKICNELFPHDSAPSHQRFFSRIALLRTCRLTIHNTQQHTGPYNLIRAISREMMSFDPPSVMPQHSLGTNNAPCLPSPRHFHFHTRITAIISIGATYYLTTEAAVSNLATSNRGESYALEHSRDVAKGGGARGPCPPPLSGKIK